MFKIINSVLENRGVFSQGEQKCVNEAVKAHDWEEYSTLNSKLKGYDRFKSFYRIKHGEWRLFAVRTKQNNLLPFCIFQPRGGKHTPDIYWNQHIETALKKLIVEMDRSPKLDPIRTCLSQNESSAKTKHDLSAAKNDTNPKFLKPSDRVVALSEKINGSANPAELEANIMELAYCIRTREQLVYTGDGYMFLYRSKAGGRERRITLKFANLEELLALLSKQLSSGKEEVLPLLFSLAELDTQLQKHYLKVHLVKYIHLLQDLLHEDTLEIHKDLLKSEWVALTQSTKIKVLALAPSLPDFDQYLVLGHDRCIQDILHDPQLLGLFLKTCDWSRYVQIAKHIQHHNLDLHIQYLENNCLNLERSPKVVAHIRPRLATHISQLSAALQVALGVNKSIVVSGSISNRKNKHTTSASAREKHYKTFKTKQWVECFEAGMDKQEFLALQHNFGYSFLFQPNEDHNKFLSKHAPDFYFSELVKNPADNSKGLVYSFLISDIGELDVDVVKRLFTHLSRLDLLSDDRLQKDIYIFLLVGEFNNLDVFEYILQVFPAIRNRVPYKVSLLRELVNCSIYMLKDLKPAKYRFQNKKLKIAMKYCDIVNDQEKDQLLSIMAVNPPIDVLASFKQAYLQALECLRFDIALALIKKVSPEQLESVSIWYNKVKVTELNIMEAIEVFGFLLYNINLSTFPQELHDSAGGAEAAAKIIIDVAKKHNIPVIYRKGKRLIFHFSIKNSPASVCSAWEGAIEQELIQDLIAGHSRETCINKARALGLINKFLSNMGCMNDSSYEQLQDLWAYCQKIGMRVSKAKIQLLYNVCEEGTPAILAVFEDRSYESQCLEKMWEIYEKAHAVKMLISKSCIQKLKVSQKSVAELVKMKLVDPLILASAVGFKNVVDFLTYELNTPMIQTPGEPTPMHFAIWEGHDDIARLLLSHDKKLSCLKVQHQVVAQWMIDHKETICVTSEHIHSLKSLPELTRKNKLLRGCLIEASLRQETAKKLGT